MPLTTKQKIVRENLIEVARRGEPVPYEDVGVWIERGPRELGPLLDAINRHENSKGRPLLSAFVVRSWEGKPGDGFWDIAIELDLFEEGEDRDDFWVKEYARVYNYWKRRASSDLQ